MVAAGSSEKPWQPIVRRKQAYRDLQIPSEWHISRHLLAKDPLLLEYGSQNVLHAPCECDILSSTEISINEDYSVKSLLSALSSRKLTACDVAAAFCKRAAIAHQLANCITELLFSSAITRAKELDTCLSRQGRVVGPLHGLPISVKDSFNIVGADSSIGVASLYFKPARTNAPLVDLLLSLGCVIIAETNVPQTLNSLDSVNNVFGRVMNLINRMRTSGGSSGGEGVIVAMNGCMVGCGADTGGSIRVATICNSIFGAKSSNGSMSCGGQAMISVNGMTRCGVQAVAGSMGRSMEDINIVTRSCVKGLAMGGRLHINDLGPWLYSQM